MLYCLNLPEHLRYLPENTCVIGLTPPPHAPSMITISHIIQPFVNSVLKYSAIPGEHVSTFRHPEGIPMQIKIAPLIADLEASRKAGGFMAHGATFFCSFCLCTSNQIEDLNLQSWVLRSGAEVREQAQLWLNTATKGGRDAQAQATGVRWTPLHGLPYWDPVKHIMLGFMHNWLEGILKHQLRTLWRIGPQEATQNAEEEIEKDEEWTDADISESASELDDLIQEAAEAFSEVAPGSSPDEAEMQDLSSPTPSPTPTLSSSHHSQSSSMATLHADQPRPYLFDLEENEDPNDLDYIPDNATFFTFTDTEFQAIRNCISNITLPTWVQRPPTNLGEPSHGKLKAHEYLSLFTCIFPLIIPEFWHSATATETSRQHLNSFHHLVAATNIISSFKTSNAKADAYTHHYTQYRASLPALFPGSHSKPNHHYAMHNGALMKYWGPLPSLSEFPGERMNGMLQNINTNRQLSMLFHVFPLKLNANAKVNLGNLDLTMLRQMSRRARVDALLHDGQVGDAALNDLGKILQPEKESANYTPTPLDPIQMATVLKKSPKLTTDEYYGLLYYLQGTGRQYQAYNALPHPQNALILSPHAERPLQVHLYNHVFSCQKSHEGNSAIQFYNPHTHRHETGFIQSIWRVPLEAAMHTFIAVRPHRLLSALEEGQAPFFCYQGFMARIVDALPSQDLLIIEPTHIVTHLTTFQRPAGTYGIPKKTLIVCWALNRERR
jgi:hypothetical protein